MESSATVYSPHTYKSVSKCTFVIKMVDHCLISQEVHLHLQTKVPTRLLLAVEKNQKLRKDLLGRDMQTERRHFFVLCPQNLHIREGVK